MRKLIRVAIMNGVLGAGLLVAAQAIAGTCVVIDGVEICGSGLFMTGEIYENAVVSPGDTLSGYGRIDSINGNRDFCANGGATSCELTFTFSNYTVTGYTGSQYTFTGGQLTVYADSSPDFDSSNFATATDGATFITSIGHTFVDTTTGLFGTLIGMGVNLNMGQAPVSDMGLLDVTGGDVATYVDTNTFDDFIDNGMNADGQFDSTASPIGCTATDLCGSTFFKF